MNMNNGNDSLDMEDQWQNFANQNDQQNSVIRQAYDSQRADLADAQNMMNVVNQQKSRQLLNIQNANGVIMWAARNGGVTPELQNWWNAKCRTSDSDSQLVGAGFDRNGVFNMTFADSNGQFQNTMSCTPLQQYQMMNNLPGIFDDNARMQMRDKLMSEGHSEQELAKYSGLAGMQTPGNLRPTSMRLGSNGWEATSGELAAPGPRPRQSRISVFASDGKGGTMTREYDGRTGEDTGFQYGGNWGPNASGQWKQMSVGPSDTFNGGSDKSQVRVYENSKTGERVTVKDGETPPWQRGAAYDKMMMERQKAADREKLKQMDLDAREKRMNAYNDERKKLREQNAKFRQLEILRKQWEKELSPEGKKKIQGQMDEIMKNIGDEVQDSDTVLGNNSSGKPTDAAGTLRRQQLGGKPSQGQSESQEESVRPFKNISEEKYAQLSEEDKKKCKRVAKGRGYVMYLDNPNGSTSGTQDNKPYPETLKGVDDDWDFSNEERDDFNRLATKYPNEFTNSEEPTNEAYRELYERLKKKESEDIESRDSSDKYTTRLTPEEESAYQKWKSTLPKELQYEGDYDLRGFYRENGGKSFKSGDHMPDKFKKPNHPTFSNESKYATGDDAKKAGKWKGEKYVKPGDGDGAKKQKSESDAKKRSFRYSGRIRVYDDGEKSLLGKIGDAYREGQRKNAILAKMTKEETDRYYRLGSEKDRQDFLKEIEDKIKSYKR